MNQTSNPAFDDWLRVLAIQVGATELWSGNRNASLSSHVTVRRGPAYDRASSWRRLFTWSAFTIWAVWRLLRQTGPVSVLVVTNPPLMVLAIWLFSRLRRLPYALLEWDIYPQILTPMGLAGPGHVLYRFWEMMHRRALRQAALVITLGEEMATTLRHLAADDRLPVEVIPNWVDTNWLTPLPHQENPFVREQGLQNKLVVLYSGNLGATHAIETILQVARLLAGETRVRFLVIGEGSKRGLVEAAIARGETPTLRLLPLQPADRLPQTLSSGHVGIVTLGAGYEGLSMPSKTYALMAAGNAILGISRPPNDVSDTIARHGCGANFSPDQAQAIADWIRGLLADPAALAQLQSHARRAAVDHYSTAHCTSQLSQAVAAALMGDDATRSARRST